MEFTPVKFVFHEMMEYDSVKDLKGHIHPPWHEL